MAVSTDIGRNNVVLVANRGEIAVRVAKGAAADGFRSVMVATTADAESLHSTAGDVSVVLRGTDPIAAHLDGGTLLAVADANKCGFVHPGYGFLAENAAFAQLCEERGLTFIGPSSEVLALFGDKVAAKALAASLDIPVIRGSDAAVATAADARDAADALGYPVMLKAAAGGGGRGIRSVHSGDDVAEAFERCSSEASGAFGDGSIFVEQLIDRPRHIEVQVLGDGATTVHLFERDCSVQLRNQKMVEVAPAVGLGQELRHRLHGEAVRLWQEAGATNAGTVEFLVDPTSGEHYFIECNPRIQVEHTITEEVMGVDLVRAQFAIAAGASLDDIGLGDQTSISEPRGISIQARVMASGSGTLTGYKEPAGPGVRVDSHCYQGMSPAPQFDPLLAKVITTTRSGSIEDAVELAARTIDEFHLVGVPTNIATLKAVLASSAVRSGDARTTLFDEKPELLVARHDGGRHDKIMSLHGPTTTTEAPVAELEVPDGDLGVVCPVPSVVLDVRVSAGDQVSAGDPLFVVTAMKMETLIAAGVSGVVSHLAAITEGTQLVAGQIVASITPGASDGRSVEIDPHNTWASVLDEVAALQELANERLSPSSEEPGVVRQRNRGKLTCRQRIELLLDDGSFREMGSLAGFASYDEHGNVVAFTPANHVGGTGTIDGRTAIVCADDFTSRGGHADGAIGAKSMHLDMLSVDLASPSVRLLDGSSGGGSVAAMVPQQKKEGESTAEESSGAITAGRPRVTGGGGSFLPGHLGSTEYAEQLASVPVVNMLLGSVVGIGAAKAVLGHFSVMVRDISQLFVAGPPVVSHAMGYEITKEDLGDWRIHCTNGSVDNVAESEEEAATMTRRFLSYLPSSVDEAPPILEPDPTDPADRAEDELFTIVPRKRTTTFDMRRAIELMADRGSFFEIGPLWGTDQITGFVRMNGHPLGVIASDSRHVNGGALTADGCRKLTRHLDLCDLFHLPVLNLVDNPGFAVGLEHEVAGTIRRGGEWMVAFAQTHTPIFTVLMRRSFGVAGNNYATPRRRNNARVVWPSADVGGIPPEGGIEAAYKRQLAEAEDPVALRAELEARIESARGPIGPLNRFQMEEMIDPRNTRRLVCEWVPTAYRVVSNPKNLGRRDLDFRP